jgi:hypothetical protein
MSTEIVGKGLDGFGEGLGAVVNGKEVLGTRIEDDGLLGAVVDADDAEGEGARGKLNCEMTETTTGTW